MTAERVFTVAQKEFTDQITGWRFLVILALFLAIALVGTYSGVVSYERELDRYSEQLAAMDNQNDGPAGMMPAKPPVEGVYSSMFLTLISYGGSLPSPSGPAWSPGRRSHGRSKACSPTRSTATRSSTARRSEASRCSPSSSGACSLYPPRSSSSSRSCPPRAISG